MRPWSVGLMTGTVLDGNIDVALLRTDGRDVMEFGPWSLEPYDASVVTQIESAMRAARDWAFEGVPPAGFDAVERALTHAQADAVSTVLKRHGIAPDEVATVGFHGQTVLHRAPASGVPGRTLQLGDGARMAHRLGIDVVAQLRYRDVAQGGQGAPLAPVYHRALLQRVGAPAGTVWLNIGGVANLTCVHDDDLIAFDSGPGNAPINDWVRRHTGEEMDRDGQLAQGGTVDEGRVAKLLSHAYFQKRWPKSLDRFDFEADMAEGLSIVDGAATLTALVAGAVALGLEQLPVATAGLVVSGGGRRNPVLMDALRQRTGLPVRDVDELGLRGDAIEAECFAFLAERCRREWPISFPGTTGVSRPTSGGILFTRAD